MLLGVALAWPAGPASAQQVGVLGIAVPMPLAHPIPTQAATPPVTSVLAHPPALLPPPVPLPNRPQASSTAPPSPSQAPQSAPPLPLAAAPSAPLAPEAVQAELGRLRAAMAQEVPHLLPQGAQRRQAVIAMAKAAWSASGQVLDRPQLVVVVDRNPRVQDATLVMAQENGPWEVIGATRVSTGQAGRFDYYYTPTGVFLHTADILDYRAQGTKNENNIRGYGIKGMRIWDFGWQTAVKAWRADRETGPIRFELHPTDPDVLERRIGSPASKGCVRVPAAMNVFLDKHGVLDVEYERAAVDSIRYRALLRRDRTPSSLAGRALIVVDSAVARPA